MDRISALRNVEEALAEFEAGDLTLADLEARVQAVLRTYATEFEAERLAVYRVGGPEEAVVVVADSPGAARQRAGELAGLTAGEVERLSSHDDLGP